jgi:hypothetical protein
LPLTERLLTLRYILRSAWWYRVVLWREFVGLLGPRAVHT